LLKQLEEEDLTDLDAFEKFLKTKKKILKDADVQVSR